MREEVKQAWIEALESGRYKQGFGLLRHVDAEGEERFCALGVLCDISGLGEWTTPTGTGDTGFRVGRHTAAASLSPAVCQWAEVNESAPIVAKRPVSDINDQGLTFAEIAALLRATPSEEIL